jgi:hypothetical protein
MGKVSIAFGLATAIALGTLARCSQVIEDPRSSGLVDRNILSLVPNSAFPTSIRNESGYTKAIYSSLTNGSEKSANIRDYYIRDYLPESDITTMRQSYTLEDFFKLAESIQRKPEGKDSAAISEEERRGFMIYVWKYGSGTSWFSSELLPNPKLGLQALASRVYRDVKDNYISSIINNLMIPNPSDEDKRKWDDFKKSFTGRENPTNLDIYFAYTFPETAIQQNLFNRQLVEGYILKSAPRVDVASRERISGLITESALFDDVKRFIDKSEKVSRFGSMFLECAASTIYNDNIKRENAHKYANKYNEEASEIKERAKGFALKAQDMFLRAGFNLDAEKAYEIINISITYDVWARPKNERKYSSFSFVCPYQ